MSELPEDLFPLYRLYHHNQHTLVDADAIDGRTERQSWETGQYKTYERLEPVVPADDERLDDEFLTALRSRRSFADATTPQPVDREELFAVLRCAYGVDGDTRSVASAGQLYPLELYPLVLDAPDVPAGLYHYSPGRDVLERPADPSYVDSQFGPLTDFVADNWHHLNDDHAVSVVFLLTGIPSRSVTKYGERGYLFTLLEAGELIHAIQLAATHLDVGSRPYAGFRYDAAAKLLGIADDSGEWVLASVALAGTD